MQAEDAPDRRESALPDLIPVTGASSSEVAGTLTEHRPQLLVHRAGRGRADRLGHGRLRHQPVLLNECDEHVPLTAVADRGVEDVGDRAVVDVAVGCLLDRVEEVVRALDLVEKHDVVLGVLEVLQLERAHRADPQQVEAGEEPAAAALLLVGDGPVVEGVRHRRLDGRDDLAVQRDVLELVLGQGVLQQAGGRIAGELLAQEFEVGGFELAGHDDDLLGGVQTWVARAGGPLPPCDAAEGLARRYPGAGACARPVDGPGRVRSEVVTGVRRCGRGAVRPSAAVSMSRAVQLRDGSANPGARSCV